MNGQPFFNVASIGFSAELARDLTEHAKKRWGTLGYGIMAARLLIRSRLFTASVEHDGTIDRIRTLQVSVGNGRHYGGGMTVEESASADDGKLDFYSLEVDHWWRLLRAPTKPAQGHAGQMGRRASLPHDCGYGENEPQTSGQHRRRADHPHAGPFSHSREGDPRVCARHAGRLTSDVGGGVPGWARSAMPRHEGSRSRPIRLARITVRQRPLSTARAGRHSPSHAPPLLCSRTRGLPKFTNFRDVLGSGRCMSEKSGIMRSVFEEQFR